MTGEGELGVVFLLVVVLEIFGVLLSFFFNSAVPQSMVASEAIIDIGVIRASDSMRQPTTMRVIPNVLPIGILCLIMEV